MVILLILVIVGIGCMISAPMIFFLSQRKKKLLPALLAIAGVVCILLVGFLIAALANFGKAPRDGYNDINGKNITKSMAGQETLQGRRDNHGFFRNLFRSSQNVMAQ